MSVCGRALIRAIGVWALLSGVVVAGQTPRSDVCVQCHSGLGSTLAQPVGEFRDDIHRERGFTCTDCHGGDASATTKAGAKNRASGYRGALTRGTVIELCARCHSDAAFMRKYAPAQRIDQAAEYATSVHGKRLAMGDAKVAICSSCHLPHGIRAVKDARSPVYPLNVTATCAKCHGTADYMRGYTREDGSPLPTSQPHDYQQSVHYAALTKGRDLSAPTCNDCHGNHGAAPPGAGSAVNVCGTCHAVFATRLNASVHGPVFERGCVECHSNHAIREPSEQMLGATPDAICSTCHDNDPGAKAATAMRAGIDGLRTTIDRVEQRVARLQEAGMELSAQELALREARTKLTLSRTEMHAFEPALVGTIVDAGLGLTTAVDQAADRADRELQFRRRGLAASMVVLLLMVGALVLKIREIERRAE
jgi:predicted CXXCH cytochrome family protein